MSVIRRKLIGLTQDGRLALKAPGQEDELIPDAIGTAVLVFDCSGSMAGEKLEAAKSGARDFLRMAIQQGYRVGVVEFSSYSRAACLPAAEEGPPCDALTGLQASGSTNMSAGIEAAIELFKGPPDHHRAIVMVTDGIPDSQIEALRSGDRAAKRGVRMIAIGTDDADHDFLRRLCRDAGLASKVNRRELARAISEAARLLPSGGLSRLQK